MITAINRVFDTFKKNPVKDDDQLSTNSFIHSKYFTHGTNWVWYATKVTEIDNLCFGYVEGNYVRYGCFTDDELNNGIGPLGFPIEKDHSFQPTTFSQIDF